MKYTTEILTLMLWPILIAITYILSLAALRYFHKKAKDELPNDIK